MYRGACIGRKGLALYAAPALRASSAFTVQVGSSDRGALSGATGERERLADLSSWRAVFGGLGARSLQVLAQQRLGPMKAVQPDPGLARGGTQVSGGFGLEHTGVFSLAPGHDDRHAPPAGGARCAIALAADRTGAGAEVRASGSARQATRQCRSSGPARSAVRWWCEQCGAATLVDPPHGQPAVPEELVQPQRRRTRAALERERVLPVLQRAGVLRAAAALRCDTDRALSPGDRRGSPGATAQGHDRDGRADRGRQARRVGSRDCRHHGAGEGHRAPGGQPLAGRSPATRWSAQPSEPASP